MPSVNFKHVKIEATLVVDGTEEDYLITPTSVDFHLLPLNSQKFEFKKSSSFKKDE